MRSPFTVLLFAQLVFSGTAAAAETMTTTDGTSYTKAADGNWYPTRSVRASGLALPAPADATISPYGCTNTGQRTNCAERTADPNGKPATVAPSPCGPNGCRVAPAAPQTFGALPAFTTGGSCSQPIKRGGFFGRR